MEIKEIESEVREQEEVAADIVQEVHNHRQQAERLEAAVHALLEAQLSVDSEGVRRAIDHAAEATTRPATVWKPCGIRSRRCCSATRSCRRGALLAVEKKQQAQEKLPKLTRGRNALHRSGLYPAFPLYGTMEALIRDSISQLASALSDLKMVRERLEALQI